MVKPAVKSAAQVCNQIRNNSFHDFGTLQVLTLGQLAYALRIDLMTEKRQNPGMVAIPLPNDRPLHHSWMAIHAVPALVRSHKALPPVSPA